jgi:hypothetical protein
MEFAAEAFRNADHIISALLAPPHPAAPADAGDAMRVVEALDGDRKHSVDARAHERSNLGRHHR